MKINGLHIYGFGQFSDVKLDFSSNFHVIYGENEAGKTTLLAFVYSILFGFPTKTQSENRYFPRMSHQYGGSLSITTEYFGNLTIERIFDNNKVTGTVKVYLEDGTTKDESFLTELLGSVNKEIFKAIFAFDLSGLQNIDNLSGDALSNYLLNAGIVGNGRLQEVEIFLEKQQAELYKPSGRNPELNRKLDSLLELNQQVKMLKNQNDSYYLLKETMEEKQDALNKLSERKVQLHVEIKRLEKIGQAVHTWQEKMIELEGDINFYKKELEGLQDELRVLQNNQNVITYKEDIRQFINEQNYYQELVFQKQTSLQKMEELNSKKEMILSRLGAGWNEESILTVEATIAGKDNLTDIEAEMERLLQQQSFLDDEMARRRESLEQLENREANLKQQGTSQKSAGSLFPIILMIAGILFSAFWFVLGEWVVGALLAIAFIGSGGYVYRFYLGTDKLPNNEIRTELFSLSDRLREARQAYTKIAERYDHWEIEMNRLEQSLEDWKNDHHFPLGIRTRHLLGHYELITSFQDYHFIFQQERQQLDKIIDKIEARHGKIINIYKSLFGADKTPVKNAILELQQLLETEEMKLQQSETLKEKIVLTEASMQKLQDRKQSYIDECNKILEQLNQSELDAIEIEKEALEQKLELIESDFQVLNKEQAEAQVKLKQLEEEGNYSESMHKLEQEKYETRELAKQWAVYKIAEWMIIKTKEKFQKEKLPKVLELASFYLEKLTNGNYTSIYLSENPKEAFLLQRKDQQRFAAVEVSRGTAEQLYLSIRLALAKEYQTKEMLPLILDDILVNFDSDRAYQSINIFRKIADDRQLLFFTCHKHILQYFDPSDIIDLNELNVKVKV